MAKPQPTPDILGDLLGRDLAKQQMININAVRVDGGTQMRAGLDDGTVFDYTQTMVAANGWGSFPAVICYYDGTTYWLADGFHRVQAYRDAFPSSIDKIPADVRAGTRRDAILHAAGANAEHGLRRTNADKQRAVEMLLRDNEWTQWSNSEIARRCVVDEKMVRTMRSKLETASALPKVTERHGADGKTYNTTNIGSARPSRFVSAVPAEPAPAVMDTTPTVVSRNNVPYQNTPAQSWEEATQGTQLAGKALAEYTGEDWAEAARIDAHRLAETAVTVVSDSEPLPVRTVVDAELFKVADDAYSAPELQKNKIRKPFLYNDAMWTCVGVSYGGSDHPESTRAECLRLHVVGEPIAPGERSSMYLETAYKAGTIVTCRGLTYVLGAQWLYVQKVAAPEVAIAPKPEPAAAVDDVPVSFRADYDSDEWYTPEEITRTAHHVMGGIDLDPATCELAQTGVQAGTYYTKVDDGLAQPWNGSVWLNPPYSAPQVWIDKLFAEMASGRVSQAIVLVNNATETAWFQRLLTESKLVCFPARRLAFWRHDHSNVAGRQGQALFYFGNRAEQFYSAYSATGAVLRRLAK